MADLKRNPKAKRWAALGGAALILGLGVLAIAYDPGPLAPPAAKQANATLVPWTDSLRAEWHALGQCLGLARIPEPTVAIWRVPAEAGPILGGEGLRVLLGQHFPDLDALWYRADADATTERERLRHELAHALLRTPTDDHEAVFFTHAEACALGDTMYFHRAPRRGGR